MTCAEETGAEEEATKTGRLNGITEHRALERAR